MLALLCSAMVVTCVRFELISLASALSALRSDASAAVLHGGQSGFRKTGLNFQGVKDGKKWLFPSQFCSRLDQVPVVQLAKVLLHQHRGLSKGVQGGIELILWEGVCRVNNENDAGFTISNIGKKGFKKCN